MIPRRPAIIDVIRRGCTMTRWRMTEEVRESLEFVREKPRPRSSKSKVRFPIVSHIQSVKSKKEKEKEKEKKSRTPPPMHASSSKHSLSRPPTGPPALSDSDGSSSSDAEELVQQQRAGGEMTERVRAAMLQYFGSRKNHTRWVLKCTSKVPEPPPHRTIKKIAIAAYENRSIDFYFVLVAK